MSFEARVEAASEQSREVRLLHLAISVAWAVPVLLALTAIIQQSVIGLDTDVSWLITVGEKVLDGQRLYIDIFEVNPPASVLIYLPGIALGRALGITAELATASLVFVLAGASIWFSGLLARSAGLIRTDQGLPTLCMAIIAFLLLPGACFAQREHIAVLTLLPFIAVVSARMAGAQVGIPAALVAGLGAGVTMAIKPHFAMAVAPMLLLLVVRRRSVLAALRVEAWASAAVVLAYVLAVLTFYPAYLTDALPLLSAVYLPSRNGFAELWLSPPSLIFFVCGGIAVFLARSRLSLSIALLPWLAALGFAAAMGVQGKGYLNHAYPFVSLAIFALGLVLAERRGDRSERLFGATAFLCLAGSSAFIFAQAQTYPELAQLVRRAAPPHPRMIVAGSNLSVGHPLTRWVGGEWVARRGALWVTGGAVALMDDSSKQQRAILQAYIDDDRQIFVEDVERGRPDIILVPGDIGRHWVASNADVRRVTADYGTAGTAEGVTVLVHRANPIPGNRG